MKSGNNGHKEKQIRPTLAEAIQAPEVCYAPHIEARRSDYEALAESLAHMIELSSNRNGARLKKDGSWLDIDGPGEGDNDHLIEGVHDHLFALWQQLDWFDVRTMRKFYVEMRLFAEQLAEERHRAHERFEERAVSALKGSLAKAAA